MSARMRNESGESKRNVVCGICGHESRRDNMKSRHFPKKHPFRRYIEKDENTIKSIFIKPNLRENEEDITENETDIILQNDDDSMDGIESVPVETSDPVLTESLFSQLAHAIKNNIHDEIEPLRKKLDELTLKNRQLRNQEKPVKNQNLHLVWKIKY